jgi:ribosomal peptide maturation radical SAM protein 1
MRSDDSRVCLVTMPFMPVLTPALGPSLLKAGLAAKGIECDLFYGSLELVRMLAEESASDAVFDYSYIATAEDLGDVFFAPALWGEGLDAVRARIERLPLLPRTPFPREVMVLLAKRLLRALTRKDEFFARCLAARPWDRYRVIGFSSTFSQNVASLTLARIIRAAAPDATVVFGGANCDGDMGGALLESFPWIDHVLQGEADLTLPRYVERLLTGQPPEPLPGLLVRRGDAVITTAPARQVVDLDDLPVPDFSDYQAQLPTPLRDQDLAIPVELSRGCWWGAVHHCVFCGLNPNGMTFRSKSPVRAVEEIGTQAARWASRSVVLVDNILDMTYFATVLPHLEPLDLSLFCEVKSNLKEAQVAALAAAGFRDIQPGIESLNTETLRHMDKGARAVTQMQLLKWCQVYGVRPLWFYLYGFPGEDAQWYLDDIELIRLIPHLPPPRNPNPVVIDRFSPLFDYPDRFGLENLRPAWDAQLSYAGVSPQNRSRLAYHFEADSPPNDQRQKYERTLWIAVSEWRDKHAAGAFLSLQAADHTTLVRDGREPGLARAYVLTGLAHRAFAALWSACTTGELRRRLHAAGRCGDEELTADDLRVTLLAARSAAVLLEWKSGADDLEAVLSTLAKAGLVARLDQRWLALATPAPKGKREAVSVA